VVSSQAREVRWSYLVKRELVDREEGGKEEQKVAEDIVSTILEAVKNSRRD
jgi:hypothetical protein